MNKILQKIMISITLVILSIYTSGCLSYMVIEQSKQKVALRKAIQSNNQAAIKAIKLGDNGVGVGIDVLNLEALTEQPIKQLGAALGDAAIIWGAYEGIQSINGDNNGNSDNTQTSDGDSNQITIKGDGNTIHVGDEHSNNETTEAP